jgi:hypothetical protein
MLSRIASCLCALALSGCTSPEESGVKVIVGARLEAIPYSVIVIANGKITAAGPQAEVPVPKGAEITRGTGKVVKPEPAGARIAPGEPADLEIQDAETGSVEKVMRDGAWVK